MKSVTLLLFLCCCLHFGFSFTRYEEKELDSFLQNVRECGQIQSLNIAIVQSNRIVFVKGLDQNGTMEFDRIFGLASLSKAFTTALLGIVMHRYSNHTWDSTMREVLGKDFYFYDVFRTLNVTLRDLASHRVGLGKNNMVRMQNGLSRLALVKKIRFLKSPGEYRSSFLYNNLLYGVLARVTEVIGKASWEELLQRHLFNPLNMSSTTLTHKTNTSRSLWATPYMMGGNRKPREVDLEVHRHWGLVGGSGSVASTAEDMIHWLQMWLKHLRNASENGVLPAELAQELTKPRAVIPETGASKEYKKPQLPETYDTDQYAMGWRVGTYRGYRQILHTGTSFGYGALLTLVPDLDLGIHTSISGPDFGYHGRRLMHMYAMNIVMGGNWINVTTVCEEMATFAGKTIQRDNNADIPHEPFVDLQKLSDYVGKYRNHAYGEIQVTHDAASKKLLLQYGPGVWNMTSHPATSGVFSAQAREPYWMLSIAHLVFRKNGGQMTLTITEWEPEQPVVFARGALKAVAPPSLKCAGSDVARSSYLIAAVVICYYFLS